MDSLEVDDGNNREMEEEDEFEEFRLRSYSGGILSADSRRRALARCRGRQQQQQHGRREHANDLDDNNDYDNDEGYAGSVHPKLNYRHSDGSERYQREMQRPRHKHHISVESVSGGLCCGGDSRSLREAGGEEDGDFSIVVHDLIDKLQHLKSNDHRNTGDAKVRQYLDYEGMSPRSSIEEQEDDDERSIAEDAEQQYEDEDNLSDDWSAGEIRPRVQSMPTKGSWSLRPRHHGRTPKLANAWNRGEADHAGLHLVRSFAITSHGLVKKGDMYVSSDSCGSGHKGGGGSQDGAEITRYHVGFQGLAGTGKTHIIRSFIKSEISGSSFNSEAEDPLGVATEWSVSILLDGEESTLVFHDLSLNELTRDEEPMDAFVIVYSVEDRSSFTAAVSQVSELRRVEGLHLAIILVANKIDLVRNRAVSEEEGKHVAKKQDCKFIEVSATMDLKIDELLVGILKQIRLTLLKYRGRRRRGGGRANKDDLCFSLKHSHNVLGKIFGKQKLTSRSCENLYVL